MIVGFGTRAKLGLWWSCSGYSKRLNGLERLYLATLGFVRGGLNMVWWFYQLILTVMMLYYWVGMVECESSRDISVFWPVLPVIALKLIMAPNKILPPCKFLSIPP
jgi:hypothetical protein